jgi:hypothetical protein
MLKGLGRRTPALVIAGVALFAALGGTVYAAGRIDGHSIKPKSIPGNRLALGSVPANRLKAGAIPGNRIAPESITGTQIDTATLGQVPTAIHADTADSAREAGSALTAVNAGDAARVNGHTAGCATGTRAFAGACWQLQYSSAPATATDAALSCANQGGELPEPLQLVAFSKEPGITLATGDEWTEDIPSYTSTNSYSVVTVASNGDVGASVSTSTKKFRCVIPLVT